MTQFKLRCEQTMIDYQILRFGVAIKKQNVKNTRHLLRALSFLAHTDSHSR